MGEPRPHPENSSSASDDSVKPPPPFDPSRVKLGPGALPPHAFDPLKQKKEEWVPFWKVVDEYFSPINLDDVRFLRSIPINPYGGAHDSSLRISFPSNATCPTLSDSSKDKRDRKRSIASSSSIDKQNGKLKHIPTKLNNSITSLRSEPNSDALPFLKSKPEHDHDIMLPSLNSFPYTHRLIAALLDENPTAPTIPQPPSSRNNRTAQLMDDGLYMGPGNEADVRSYQSALETRVKLELIDHCLLDETKEQQLHSSLRQQQWILRDYKMVNRMRKTSLYTRIIGIELRQQARAREVKRHEDQVEIAYLETMMGNMKKNKKSRSKYQKLMHKMFAGYKDKSKITKPGKPTNVVPTTRLLLSGDEKRPVAAKKKRKSDFHPSKSAKAAKRGSL